jgi:hypothetical protein
MTAKKKLLITVAIGPVTLAQCQAIVGTFAALGHSIGETLDVETCGALELVDQRDASDVTAPDLGKPNAAPTFAQEAPASSVRAQPPSSRWN